MDHCPSVWSASTLLRNANQRARFLGAFVRKPSQVGAIAPSSSRLAERMFEGVNLSPGQVVVEFGPGTGSFTTEIKRRLTDPAIFFAMELNPIMADIFARNHPTTSLHRRDVAEVDKSCIAEGLAAENSVDLIISGLPWASFPDDTQERILAAAKQVLKPGGMLVTFGYHVGTWLPAGRRFYKRLPNYFSKVERSGWVWWNTPPAFAVRCMK